MAWWTLILAAAWLAPGGFGLAPVKKSLGRQVADFVFESPLYRSVVVPRARATMRSTAEKNGVPWADALEWIRGQADWNALVAAEAGEAVPAYYDKPFHAYDRGNLCVEAALEAEIASKAVGARNYPAFGRDGEDAFRGAFDDALLKLGASLPDGGLILDLGCGTGLSTRRLARQFPKASKVIGVDLSPHMVAVAKRLDQLGEDGATGWVNDLTHDPRLEYRNGAAEDFVLDEKADLIVLSLVVHEIPPEVTRAIFEKCYLNSKPGAQIWVFDMDFDTPGFKNLRANPLLFSLIRSTEPYLDIYADYGVSALAADVQAAGYNEVSLRAATGRHYALLATKNDDNNPVISDRRQETQLPDTHLASWEVEEAS